MKNGQDTQNILDDGYHSLMLGYASGKLSYAESLIVEAHVQLSEKGRHFLNEYEAIGACLLEKDCEPVAMSNGALDNVFSMIESFKEEKHINAVQKSFPGDISVPKALLDTLSRNCSDPHWRNLYPGLKTLDMDLECKRSTARFLKVDPGMKTPHHKHAGLEITLVLDGAYNDETGVYKRGDLVVADDTIEHQPVACPKLGCTCMVVSSAPIKLTGIKSILNPFIKF